MIQQVDKAMEESTIKHTSTNDNIEYDNEEVPEPPDSTIRIQSTRPSQLRKQSARSRLEMYKNLPPGRQEEYEAYAGEVLKSDKKKRERSRKKN